MAALRHPFLLLLLLVLLSFSLAAAFQSDELLLHDDDEFEGAGARPAPATPPAVSSRRRSADAAGAESGSSAVQFALEHDLGAGFVPAGSFSARLKSSAHGSQTLTKLRFTRNELTGDEKDAFKKLLNEDGFYSIRLLSNVLDSAKKDYVVSSIKARCIPRESLDEHIVIHMDGVNILAVNYGSVGGCQYPRPVKMPSKWIFNSYTVLKTSEQAPRTPSFVDQLIEAENGLGEVVKPPEKSFWAKYWMYIIPLGLIVMNAVTAAANMPEEAGGQGQPGAQRAPNAAPRRR
uniref:ER membrane protein complex subunit 10 n=1 Tax=Leersia perrieri TaxID=77586 RepID=A0A0D9XR18_9ORYZ